MSLAYHSRIRFMQPLRVRFWLAVCDVFRRFAQLLVDGIGVKP